MSYQIIKLSDESVVCEYKALPKSLEVGSRRIVSPVSVGDEGTINGETYRLVEVVRNGTARPGRYLSDAGETVALTPTQRIITRQWTYWTQAEIDAYEAAQDDSLIDELLAGKLGKILFALAKSDPMPNLTPTQFRNYVKGL